MISRLTHFIAIFSILSLSFPVTAMAQATISDDLRNDLETLVDVTRDLQEVVEEDADLIEVLLTQTGRDAEALRDFVGGSIAYVPYTGVLRGAAGTLRSGIGNSYDQSLTLMTVMKRAGYEGQILVGDMAALGDVADFSTASRALSLPDRAVEIEELTREIDEIIADIEDDLGRELDPVVQIAPAEPLDPAIAETAAEQAGSLLQIEPIAPLVEDPMLYAIVRYRESLTQDWLYFDPARNEMLDAFDISDFTVLNDAVPQEHTHQLTITIAAQSSTFGSVVVAEQNITVANLNIQPITFSVLPSGDLFTPEQPQTFDPNQSIVILSDQFQSMILSLSGQVVSLEEGASVMGAVFRTGSGLMGDAMASLQAEEKVDTPPLDRIVMNIATTIPGRDLPITAERVLLDAAAIAEMVEVGLPFETSDPVRSAMLAVSAGSYVVYTGTHPLVENEKSEQVVRGLTDMVDGLVSEATDTFDQASNDVSYLMSDQLAEIFPEDIARGSYHASPSVALLRTVTGVGETADDIAIHLQSDVLIDGRYSNVASDALRWAVTAAGREMQTVSRLAEALEYGPERISSYGSLIASISAGTAPIAVDAYLADLATRPSSVALEQQKEFLEQQLAVGKQIAVWPNTEIEQTVWVEFDPATQLARMASNDGAGQAFTEEELLVIAVALWVTILNVGKCASQIGQASEAATYRCLGCASLKFALAMATVSTFGVGYAVGTVAAEGYCL